MSNLSTLVEETERRLDITVGSRIAQGYDRVQVRIFRCLSNEKSYNTGRSQERMKGLIVNLIRSTGDVTVSNYKTNRGRLE